MTRASFNIDEVAPPEPNSRAPQRSQPSRTRLLLALLGALSVGAVGVSLWIARTDTPVPLAPEVSQAIEQANQEASPPAATAESASGGGGFSRGARPAGSAGGGGP